MVEDYAEKILWDPEYALKNGLLAGVSEKRQIFRKHPEEGYINLYFNYMCARHGRCL